MRIQVVAAAMIDRIVHHADVLTLQGASYRLRDRGIDSLPSIRTQNQADWTHQPVASFSTVVTASDSGSGSHFVIVINRVAFSPHRTGCRR